MFETGLTTTTNPLPNSHNLSPSSPLKDNKEIKEDEYYDDEFAGIRGILSI